MSDSGQWLDRAFCESSNALTAVSGGEPTDCAIGFASFALTPTDGLDPAETVVSAPITPTGLDSTAGLTTSPGLEVRIDGGPWTTGGELPVGASFELRATAPASFAQSAEHTVSIGAVDESWRLATRTNPVAAWGGGGTYGLVKGAGTTVLAAGDPGLEDPDLAVGAGAPGWVAIDADTGELSITGEVAVGAHSFTVASHGEVGGVVDLDVRHPTSCTDLDDARTAAGTGTFTGHATVDLDGGGPGAPLTHWCDGPDTLIAAQFEGTPVAWDAGVATDFDYRAAVDGGQSFAFGEDQLPAHSELAFGRVGGTAATGDEGVGDFGVDGEVLDRVAFAYGTGDIPSSVVEGLGGEVRSAGTRYYLNRYGDGHVHWHDPETQGSKDDSDRWSTTLALTAITDGGVETWVSDGVGAAFDWMFSPLHDEAGTRGYGYDGDYLPYDDEATGWALWVGATRRAVRRTRRASASASPAARTGSWCHRSAESCAPSCG